MLTFSYVYQTWIYKVDPTRVNEFGQIAVEGEATSEGREQAKAAAASTEVESKKSQ